MTWEETDAELTRLCREMDAIHERLPGKDNRVERERALTPWRKLCKEVGDERYALVMQT
jgi:hypothetical protein